MRSFNTSIHGVLITSSTIEHEVIPRKKINWKCRKKCMNSRLHFETNYFENLLGTCILMINLSPDLTKFY